MRVQLRVIPNAQRDVVGGSRAGALLVRVQAPAVDGRATAAVTALVAAAFGVRSRDVSVLQGALRRDKLVEIAIADEIGQATLKALLGEAPGGVVR